MERGAWDSGFYDNGRDFQKARATPAEEMEAGTAPAMYNPSPVAVGRDSRAFGVMVVSLRSALIFFTLIAFSVMAANKESFYNAYYGVYSTTYSKSTIKFSAVKAFVLECRTVPLLTLRVLSWNPLASFLFSSFHHFPELGSGSRICSPSNNGVNWQWCRGLLSVDSIVCFYAIVQLLLSFVQVSTNGTFISSATTGGSLLTFIFDTVLAYALIAAAAAAADAQSLLADNSYCDSLPGFCRKAQASIAMSFFAFAILATSAALFPMRLLRLSK